MESLEHAKQRSHTCIWRARAYRWNGDIEGRSSLWTVSKFDRQPTFVTAVLAATGRNRLNCAFSAVAGGVSYCCRPAVQEIGIRGDEHSSGRQGVSVNLRIISVAATTLDITPNERSGFERSNANMPVL